MPDVDSITFRGLSLSRPWPFTFTNGELGKRIENRPFKPPRTVLVDRAGRLPVRLALHASQTYSLPGRDKIREIAGISPPDDAASPHSIIFATCLVYGHVCDPARLGAQARWFLGPYAWLLDEFIVLDEPVPCIGGQGLWKFDKRPEPLRTLRAAYQRGLARLAK